MLYLISRQYQLRSILQFAVLFVAIFSRCNLWVMWPSNTKKLGPVWIGSTRLKIKPEEKPAIPW